MLLAAVLVSVYVAVSYFANGAFGFPLDDAWIHQVYARNLGTRFEFAFFPGQPSAGSTSPLWTILLAIGYAAGIDYRVWTIFLGIVLLGASGYVAALFAERVWASVQDSAGESRQKILGRSRLAIVAGLVCLLEWHLVWAAASGMEVMLFIFLSLVSVILYFQSTISTHAAVGVGIAGGLLTLTRPEGIILTALLIAGMTLNRYGARLALQNEPARASSPRGEHVLQIIAAPAAAVILFALVLAPYLWFNLQMGGTLLPNTFYAKAAEYASLTSGTPFLLRWLGLYPAPFTGAQILLLPGLIYFAVRLIRSRNFAVLVPALWILVLPALYAWRLPVSYQFGRYEMPIIPFVMVYGVGGTALLLPKLPLRALRRVAQWSLAALLAVFLATGSSAYASAVGIINCEMVATAEWTRVNLPPGALLAAHDIGAQGYFDSHPLLDMAGLVSPKVLAFIRDETKLMEWMEARGAQYAVFFPSWYPQLARDPRLEPIHSTGCALTRELGEENLAVFKVRE